MNYSRLPLAVTVLALGVGFSSGALAQTAPFCGPMDVVFVVDDTGSMGGAIANIKAGISSIAGDVVAASGGDYQMGLVSFKDNVQTDVDLAAGLSYALGDLYVELSVEYDLLDLPNSKEDGFGVWLTVRREFPNLLVRK